MGSGAAWVLGVCCGGVDVVCGRYNNVVSRP